MHDALMVDPRMRHAHIDPDADGPEAKLRNLLGAAAVAIADEIHAEAARTAGHAAAGPAALTALLIHKGASVDKLARVLGLSHSGTVRLVDRLERDELVRRLPGNDGRAVSLELTPEGERRGTGVAGARAAVADEFIAGLDADERRALKGLLEKLLVTGVDDWGAVQHRCRLCDLESCHADGEACPLDRHMAELAG
jgi:MarR family transcriptional regulator, negative regulator of the multidrug operon emrRAB